jgi:excisionase family DNA binding protein
MKLIGALEAARRLGISRRRVVALIHTGRLPAVMIGRTWAIRPVDLARVQTRIPGYPKGRPRIKKSRRQS